MSRNGSGTYNLPAGNPVVTGTTITSTWANSTLSDIGNALTGSVASDGQTPMSGSLNMGNNQITNMADPTTTQSAATKAYVDAASATYLLKASNLSDVANAATARTNLLAAGTAVANTFTATQTFNGTSSTKAASLLNIAESANIAAAAPSATTNFYLNSGAVQYYTSNTTTNFTLNFAFSSGTTLNAALAVGDCVSVSLLVTNGATAYYPSAFQVDGTSVTVKWQNGVAPSVGSASAIDSYTFAIIKTASAAYTIIGSQTKFA
jgi:hypothetical protein